MITVSLEEIIEIAQVYNRMDPGALKRDDPEAYMLAQFIGKFFAQNVQWANFIGDIESITFNLEEDNPLTVTLVLHHGDGTLTFETTDGILPLPDFAPDVEFDPLDMAKSLARAKKRTRQKIRKVKKAKRTGKRRAHSKTDGGG